mgnify:FL=1
MKNYNVNRIEKNTLQINGLGNNPLWDKAEIINDFISPWDATKLGKIELRALWDLDNIYFCFYWNKY